MKTVTVRDLRYHFSELEARLRQGEEIVIRRRRQVVGKLVPMRPNAAKPYVPDFAARRRRIFGGKAPVIDMVGIVAWDRVRDEGLSRYQCSGLCLCAGSALVCRRADDG
jgi:antitoxin (DNA-binding transcriptional repressor) of toxin-antitoxin stability system